MSRPMECRECDCRQAFYDGLGEALPPDPSTACICKHSFKTHVYRTETTADVGDVDPADIPTHWNYRVLVEGDGGDGEVLSVIEAFYYPADDTVPGSWAPTTVVGDSVEDVRSVLDLMRQATQKPLLIRAQRGGDRLVELA